MQPILCYNIFSDIFRNGSMVFMRPLHHGKIRSDKEMATQIKEKMLVYKGKPLVRCGNTIYYGSMTDKYVTLLQILSTADYNGQQMASNVSVQLLTTNPEHGPKERIVKKTEKNGLYNALNIASIWLTRYLEI